MFAEVAADLGTTVVAAVTAVAITLGFVCQIILQLMTRAEARRIAVEVKTAADQAHHAATKAQQAAMLAAAEVREVKVALATNGGGKSNENAMSESRESKTEEPKHGCAGNTDP